MREILTTAGMNWISDAGHYLRTRAIEDGESAVRIVRTYDYKNQRHYAPYTCPFDIVRARKHGNGIRYSINGANFPANDFVRVIAELGRRVH